MGCCAANPKFQLEIPFESSEEYDKLKKEIEQFLSEKNQKEKINKNKLLGLLIKLSNQISKFENEINKFQRNKSKNENLGEDFIEGINQDIKILKDYQTTLNNLVKVKDNNDENEQQNEEVIDKEIIINNNEEEEENNEILKNNNKNEEKKEKENSDIYFKKSIRRNKKGILNQKYYFNKNKDNENESTKNIEIVDTNDNLHLNSNDSINIIFEFENGKRVGLHANKDDKFKDVIERLGEVDTGYETLDDLQFFDGNININDKILRGDKVGDFNLNDYHLIKILFDTKIN